MQNGKDNTKQPIEYNTMKLSKTKGDLLLELNMCCRRGKELGGCGHNPRARRPVEVKPQSSK